MVDAGIVQGVGNGLLGLDGNTSRAAIMTMMDRSISDYITEGGSHALTGTGITIVKAGTDVTLTGTAKDIIVAPASAEGSVTLDQTTVTGTISIDADHAQLVAKDAKLVDVVVNAAGAAVDLQGKTATETVTVAATAAGAALTVAKDAKLDNATVAALGTTTEVADTVKHIDVTKDASGTQIKVEKGAVVPSVATAGDRTAITGTGSVKNVTVTAGEDVKVSTPNTVTTETKTEVDKNGNTVTVKTETTNNGKGEAGTVKTETTTTTPDGETKTESKTETPNKPTGGDSSSSGTSHYTVTFDAAGGSAVASQSVASGGKVAKPEDPTKAELVFCGWLMGGEPYEFDSTVTGSITLTARWGKKLALTGTLQETMTAALTDTSADVFILPAGTYAEQIVLDGAEIARAVTFLGMREVTITGPADYNDLAEQAAIAGENVTYSGLVVLKNFAQPLILEALTVMGDKEKASTADNVVHGSRYLLLALLDSSAGLHDVTLTDAAYRDDLKGMQNGIGLYAVATAPRTLTVRNSAVTNFNKCGILTRANVGLEVTGTTITGYGTQAWIAQNGIQCAGDAAILGNTIKDLNYIAGNEWTNGSCGVLDAGKDKTVTIDGNSFDNVDWPVSSEQATGGDTELGFQGTERVVAYNGTTVYLFSGEKLRIPDGVKLTAAPGGKLTKNGELDGEVEGKISYPTGVGLTQATGYDWAAYSSGDWMAVAVLVGDAIEVSELESVRFELKDEDRILATWTGDQAQIAVWPARYEQYWEPEGTPRWWEAYFPAWDVEGLVIADGKGTISDDESTIVVPGDFAKEQYPTSGMSAEVVFETATGIYSISYEFSA